MKTVTLYTKCKTYPSALGNPITAMVEYQRKKEIRNGIQLTAFVLRYYRLSERLKDLAAVDSKRNSFVT